MENMENLAGGGTVKYIKPQMEIVELSGKNVIVTSCTPVDAPWWSGEGG